jgi:hypothetical protein
MNITERKPPPDPGKPCFGAPGYFRIIQIPSFPWLSVCMFILISPLLSDMPGSDTGAICIDSRHLRLILQIIIRKLIIAAGTRMYNKVYSRGEVIKVTLRVTGRYQKR